MEISHVGELLELTRWKRVERPYQAAKVTHENIVINSSNCLEFREFRANHVCGEPPSFPA